MSFGIALVRKACNHAPVQFIVLSPPLQARRLPPSMVSVILDSSQIPPNASRLMS